MVLVCLQPLGSTYADKDTNCGRHDKTLTKFCTHKQTAFIVFDCLLLVPALSICIQRMQSIPGILYGKVFSSTVLLFCISVPSFLRFAKWEVEGITRAS